MPDVLQTAEYLVRHPLNLLIRPDRIQLPSTATGSTARPELERVVQQGLRAKIVNCTKPIAGIKLRPPGMEIIMSVGFLCERWRSSYRLAKIYNGNPQGFPDYEFAWPSQDVPFVWPEDVPGPDSLDNQIVITTNILFPVVITATVLHEVGHAVHRTREGTSIEIELACDAFAMDYLLGTANPAGREIITLSVAIWLCCICAESLLYTEHDWKSHPNPVVRMEQFAERYLAPYADNSAITAIQMLCVGHVVNLAKIRREDECAAVCASDENGDLPTLLHALGTCWDVKA